MAERYAIRSKAEAVDYLKHPVLGARLRECAAALLRVEGRTVEEIMGYPDDLKLKSSMTLFLEVSDEDQFAAVLEKYFAGEKDAQTLEILQAEERSAAE